MQALVSLSLRETKDQSSPRQVDIQRVVEFPDGTNFVLGMRLGLRLAEFNRPDIPTWVRIEDAGALEGEQQVRVKVTYVPEEDFPSLVRRVLEDKSWKLTLMIGTI